MRTVCFLISAGIVFEPMVDPREYSVHVCIDRLDLITFKFDDHLLRIMSMGLIQALAHYFCHIVFLYLLKRVEPFFKSIPQLSMWCP